MTVHLLLHHRLTPVAASLLLTSCSLFLMGIGQLGGGESLVSLKARTLTPRCSVVVVVVVVLFLLGILLFIFIFLI